MKLLHWIPLLILPLAGCQSAPVSYATPYDNPYNLLPPGTVIKLNQALSFSPGNSRSRIQSGVAIGQSRYDRFNAMCEFYLYESKDAMKVARSIQPDTFTIIKAAQNTDFTRAQNVDVAYVGIGGPLYFGGPFDDDAGTRTMKTTMWLRSDNQPQVHELRCMRDDDPWLRRFVTINEMVKTLGDVVSINLPVVTQ